MATGMVDVAEAASQLKPLGFERVEILPGSTYRNSSTIIVVPTLGKIHWRVVNAWMGLMAPMNQKRMFLFAAGEEVGLAYNRLIEHILANPDLSTWKYVLTLEDDNLVPPDAHLKLLETICHGGYDAVGGLYFTKGDFNMPMAYGDPVQYAQTGVLEFQPLDVRRALQVGGVVEVNGLAMGCTLYRMELFRAIQPPWFVSAQEFVPEKGAFGFTQDLWFCKAAKQAGKRFAVDCRVKVGHLDTATGIVY